ncbi:hypothetical protein K491DRAFT_745287 [Lophiostoma macrostomum CBS 122681]|uniref:Killer toxin Kp4 domain-containing protein n=1 Tax=Lophiostoma macrostomum CBS 122681 TaxID=1314788 RepID=A0A6A6TBP3_9PLEO|nr:hypothetical protein K491DRAFT_745287 [Lophiostoma macrostomum CBS 122681]
MKLSGWVSALAAFGTIVFAKPLRPETVSTDGTDVANVGDLVGSALYGSVYQALDWLCPLSEQQCKYDDAHKPVVYKIPVRYVDGTTLMDDSLEVGVLYSHYGTNDALRRLFIGTIAGAVQKASEHKGNCHLETYGVALKYNIVICTINNFVGVVVRDGVDYMVAEFKTNGKDCCNTNECSSVRPIVEDSVKDLLPEYKSALGGEDVSEETNCLANTAPPKR